METYQKLYTATNTVLSGTNSALSQASMVEARLKALPEEAQFATLKRAYLEELGRTKPILQQAKEKCEYDLAFFGKELPEGTSKAELMQNIKELSAVKDNLDNHKKHFCKAMQPIEAFAKKG